MRFLRLTIAYDGTDYFGWQWQPDRPTVQGVLERALGKVTGESIRATASGRTDAGVHALGQAVGIATESCLEPKVLCRAINANLPPDVRVHDICEAPVGFDAIRGAAGKRYRYVLLDDKFPDIFTRNYCWHVRGGRLDAEQMHQAAQALRGEQDFRSFEGAGSKRVTTVRRVRDISVERRAYQEGQRVVLEVEANGFLYNMVRNIVGTLVEVGRNKRSVVWPREVFNACDRRCAGITAPPQGLYLVRVMFDF